MSYDTFYMDQYEQEKADEIQQQLEQMSMEKIAQWIAQLEVREEIFTIELHEQSVRIEELESAASVPRHSCSQARPRSHLKRSTQKPTLTVVPTD